MRSWPLVLILLVVGGLLHAWRLGIPREVIFDEVHFGKFVTAYCCTRERFFDIHPPHGKLLIAGTARLFGYGSFDSAQGEGFDFEHIGKEYGEISPLPLRLFPALTGILLPLVFYGLLRQWGVSPPLAFLGGLAAVLDNALVVQTRIIALDGLLLLTTFGSLLAFLLAQKTSGPKAWWLYALAGALAGLAAGTKFTGLAALALLGVLQFSKFDFKNLKTWFLRGLVILGSALVIYMAGWWLHFALLTQPGSGDVWGLPSGNFWQDTVKLHQTMLSANYNLTATHPDESKWWHWPLMLTSIFYWSGDQGEVIYFLGNPAVWWGTTVLFIWAFLLSRRAEWKVSWVAFAGFLIAMIPLMRVPRALFLYHYLTPLFFSLAFGLVWLERSVLRQGRRQQFLVLAALLVAVFFVIFAPLTFGLSVPATWLSRLYWLPGWR